MRIEIFPEMSKDEWIEKFRFTELKKLSSELMMAAWCAWTGSYQFCAPWCDGGFKEEVLYVTKERYENFYKPFMKALEERVIPNVGEETNE